MTTAVNILFVHGVGISPATFDRAREQLGALTTSAPERLGYRAADEQPAWDAMVAELLACAAALAPVVLTGVSGGATLALALALRLSRAQASAAGILHVLAHEPLIGPLAPALHAQVSSSAAALADDQSPSAALRFVEQLVGADTWATLPPDVRRYPEEHAATVRREVPEFVRFAPTPADLAAVGVPFTVTVGTASSSARHAAARELGRLAGAAVRTVKGGHLACWEHPESFAASLSALTTEPFHEEAAQLR